MTPHNYSKEKGDLWDDVADISNWQAGRYFDSTCSKEILKIVKNLKGAQLQFICEWNRRDQLSNLTACVGLEDIRQKISLLYISSTLIPYHLPDNDLKIRLPSHR